MRPRASGASSEAVFHGWSECVSYVARRLRGHGNDIVVATRRREVRATTSPNYLIRSSQLSCRTAAF